MICYRWANEDPNPTAKVSEAARLVTLGEEGIAASLDPEFVQAIREMDELEGIVERRIPLPPQEQPEPEVEVEEERVTKRARIEPPQPTKAIGILSGNTLDSLKHLAGIQSQPVQNVPVAVKVGLGALADYGSDSD